MRPFPKITLVTGGASSGKSAWAEGFVRQSGHAKTYIATAQAFDDEMRAKIKRHKALRGQDWQTIEAPFDLAQAVAKTQPEHIILIDCLTMWLSNHLLAETPFDPLINALLSQIGNSPAPIVMVTNEVGHSVVPENALARRFQAFQGRLNQKVAGRADLVVAVFSGLPLILKGTLPEGAP